MSWSEKYKPSLAMVSVQFGFAGMNLISKVALNKGMSPSVLVFYRHVVATVVTAPLAFFLERKTRPKLSLLIFCEIFISGFLGATLNQNLYYTGMNYTSATFASALGNMLPAVTFLMAILFRLEKVGIRRVGGQAKVVGTAACVGGAMIMILYKGAQLKLWPSLSPLHLKKHNVNQGNINTEWIKGSLFLVASSTSWAAWFILQAKIGKKYSAPYSSTAIMCCLVSIQSAVITVGFEGAHSSVWALGWDVKLLTAVYSGVVASGMAFSVMSWCVRKRGPVFVTMFNPLQLIIVAVVGSIILDEKLHLGGVIGALLIVTGLYAVLWGKAKEIPKLDSLGDETTPDSDTISISISNSKEHGDNIETAELKDVKPSFQSKNIPALLTDTNQRQHQEK